MVSSERGRRDVFPSTKILKKKNPALLVHRTNSCEITCQKFPAELRLSELSSEITSDGASSPCVG